MRQTTPTAAQWTQSTATASVATRVVTTRIALVAMAGRPADLERGAAPTTETILGTVAAAHFAPRKND